MRNIIILWLALPVLFLVILWAYTTNPPLIAKPQKVAIPQQEPNISLPSAGQAAYGAIGYGVLVARNNTHPAPIASIAKVITALAILEQKPLSEGQVGPLIKLSTADELSYKKYSALGGSVVPVAAGETITEQQALQAMMLPSANNIADTASVWAFGSSKHYTSFANSFVKEMGMSQTHVADASGFSASTVSTADDLVRLGITALENPVLSGIVKQSTVKFPLVGAIRNTNWLLGVDGIIGIKTGETDQAKGCFLFGAKRVIGEREITVVGALTGQSDRNQAMAESRKIINKIDTGFEYSALVKKGTVVGAYELPWGGQIPAVAAADLKTVRWKASPPKISYSFDRLYYPDDNGAIVGSITTTDTGNEVSVPVVLKGKIAEPSLWWRLVH